MTEGLDFIAIDFETATGKRASICEAGMELSLKSGVWLALCARH